jgi:hypothetical protein
MDAPNQLNYDPKPPAFHRARRRILRIIAALLIIAVALFWIITGSSALRRAYYLHQCLNFQQPPTHIVWETNRGTILHQEINATLNIFTTGPIKKVYGAPVFLHELYRPDGSRRLVSLEFEPWRPGDSPGQFRLLYQSWNVSVTPKATEWNLIAISTSSGTPLSHWKFFAGQTDPANPSHFTFDYELDGTRHTCDAWLHNDGKLLLSQRP